MTTSLANRASRRASRRLWTATTPVRHVSRVLGAEVIFNLCPPERMSRPDLAFALASAVAELRAVEALFSKDRSDSAVAAVRRDAPQPNGYPPVLADVVARCLRVRAVTDWWFDPWAMPGGFDPSGMLRGWAAERAAAVLTEAGLSDFVLVIDGDAVVRGQDPRGGPWRVGIRGTGPAPVTMLTVTDAAIATAGTTGRVLNPRSGELASALGSATVVGQRLGVAEAYAVGLVAAGPAGLDWFPTADGYEVRSWARGEDAPVIDITSARGRCVPVSRKRRPLNGTAAKLRRVDDI